MKRLALTGMLTLVIAAVTVPAHASGRVWVNIGAPVYRAPIYRAPLYRSPFRPVPVAPVAVVPAVPYPGRVWQPAQYVWTAYGYQVVPGMWVPAPYVAPPSAYVARPVVVGPYRAPRGLALGVRVNAGRGRRW